MKKQRVHDFMETMLEPCPVCGKQPKLYRDVEYEALGYGAMYMVQCKPFMGEPHAMVRHRGDDTKSAMIEAMYEWERVCRFGKRKTED